MSELHLETLAVHAGHEPDAETGAVAPPIYLSTNYARNEQGVPLGGHTYIRESNPTQTQLEGALALLEGAAGGLVFGSGVAAGVTLLQALPQGSHVLFPDDAYYGFRVVAEQMLPGWGLHYDFVAMDDLEALGKAIRPETLLVWLETPSNPLLKVVDLNAAVALAREVGALTLVDNTFATPVLQRPLEMGCDLVLHSTTKYFGGHSDVQGGALLFAQHGELLERVDHLRHILGPVASPFNSWLVMRGMRTLPVRIQAQSASALALAKALAEMPSVAKVHYPGLPSHPGHAVAARQMSAFGAMLSIQVAGGKEHALSTVARAQLFTRATSLGGVESLIEHRASSEAPGSPVPQDLLRISVGLEHPDDLIADLAQALGG
jgi:cystathionine gamma-synthase